MKTNSNEKKIMIHVRLTSSYYKMFQINFKVTDKQKDETPFNIMHCTPLFDRLDAPTCKVGHCYSTWPILGG